MASNIHTLHKKRTYVGGPENERENKRRRMTYSDIIGTSQHENRKEQMKQYSADWQAKSKEKGTNVQNRVVKVVKI